jgi:hypothetical protein
LAVKQKPPWLGGASLPGMFRTILISSSLKNKENRGFFLAGWFSAMDLEVIFVT